MKIDNEIQIRMAEECGFKYWHNSEETLLLPPNETWPAMADGFTPGIGDGPLVGRLPDYLNDRNAIHEAWLSLDFDGKMNYARALFEIAQKQFESRVSNTNFHDEAFAVQLAEIESLTTRQRVEAFLLARQKLSQKHEK